MEEKKQESDQKEPVDRRVVRLPKIPYASVISTIALIISCTTFYYSNIREIHSLQIGLVSVESTVDSIHKNVDYEADLILLNRGNRTEAVVSISFVHPLPKDEADVLNVKSYIEESKQGPYVLKAGDAVPIHLSDKIDIGGFNVAGARLNPRTNRKEMALEIMVSSVSPTSGSALRKIVMRQKVFYDLKKDKIVIPLEYERFDLNLYELLDERQDNFLE